MIDQAGPDLFMFSSDYPHPEGGKDPLAKFKEALWTTGGDAQSRFYHDNMAELLSGRAAA
jgi:predicted TIM-barrel fold metal-dependent hydrolase